MLKKGDLIGIIAPSSPVIDQTRIEKSTKYFEQLGYNVLLGENLTQEFGYLAGTDEQRVADLHSMFQNKDVKAIFCLRGGFGAAKLLDKINYSLIRKNPKIFVGYSDITNLHLAFLAKAGLISFAGPMAASDFGGEIDPFAEESLWKVLTGSKKIGKIYNPDMENFYSLNKGKGEGKLIGGSLSNIVNLIGTEYLPSFQNSILLLEDINEQPYKIDRMLNQLKLAKLLNKTQGIILGKFVDCFESDSDKKTLTLSQVIDNNLLSLEIPIIYNVKHGHIPDKITFPIGVKTKINASHRIIQILESAVT